MWERKPSFTGKIVNCSSSSTSRCGGTIKNLKINIRHDPAMPLLWHKPRRLNASDTSCSAMFTAALFTIARKWKQPKCPSADKWTMEMWHMHTVECYPAIKKKNEIVKLAGKLTGLEKIVSSKVAQTLKAKVACSLSSEIPSSEYWDIDI